MEPHYYPGNDSLYVECRAAPGVKTHEVTDGLNVEP